MEKNELVSRIKSGYVAFDSMMSELDMKYPQLSYPLRHYYSMEDNLSKSEGNVSLYFNMEYFLSENIRDEIRTIFAKCFPYPIGTGV